MAPPPFRADHIGSLKRPDDLLRARAAVDAGKMTKEQLRPIEEVAIKNVVALQKEVGIKSITDGEFSRHMFFDGFFNNLEGMELVKNPPREYFNMWVPDIKGFFESHAEKPADVILCRGKLVRNKPMYRPEFELLKTFLKPEEVGGAKITLCAPEWFHLRHIPHAYPKEVYADDAAYFADIAKAYRAELADLYGAGCRSVQFDDPILAYFCSESMLAGMKAEGYDSDAMLDSYIKLYNDCIEGRPKDMVVGVHLCRGNFKNGMHFSEGGYDKISRKLFQELNADTFYLEYDTERAGGFEPLADLPAHKTVVLGLVTSKFPKLEDKGALIARIKEAASFMGEAGLERLMISPQCGFASHEEGNDMTHDDVKKKLQLVVEVSKAVWSDA
ncbi:UROD/MetE-like protein [Meredithblackwellia eburnea MCA 4105]